MEEHLKDLNIAHYALHSIPLATTQKKVSASDLIYSYVNMNLTEINGAVPDLNQHDCRPIPEDRIYTSTLDQGKHATTQT